MANFHPRTHQNAARQLHQSLNQLKQALAVSPELPLPASTPAEQKPASGQDIDWEAALESAAKGIENYFSH